MSVTSVALLRGVNVAGHARLKMNDLREVFTGLGFTAVSTYIQSGNVIFTSDGHVATSDLENAIRSAFALDVRVMQRTRAELERIVRSNPFAHTDDLHVGFTAQPPSCVSVEQLGLAQFTPDRAVIDGSEVYLQLPNGVGRAKLPTYLARRLKLAITVRNWNTVCRLLELTSV